MSHEPLIEMLKRHGVKRYYCQGLEIELYAVAPQAGDPMPLDPVSLAKTFSDPMPPDSAMLFASTEDPAPTLNHSDGKPDA